MFQQSSIILCSSSLKRGVDISADCIPCLPTELAIHQVVEVILLRRSFQKECITFFEEWTWSGI